MSEHHATIEWKRETPDFAYESYNRDHDWQFDAGTTVRASAAPAYLGSESCVDPEDSTGDNGSGVGPRRPSPDCQE